MTNIPLFSNLRKTKSVVTPQGEKPKSEEMRKMRPGICRNQIADEVLDVQNYGEKETQ